MLFPLIDNKVLAEIAESELARLAPGSTFLPKVADRDRNLKVLTAAN